jgi:hypothetical protein
MVDEVWLKSHSGFYIKMRQTLIYASEEGRWRVVDNRFYVAGYAKGLDGAKRRAVRAYEAISAIMDDE